MVLKCIISTDSVEWRNEMKENLVKAFKFGFLVFAAFILVLDTVPFHSAKSFANPGEKSPQKGRLLIKNGIISAHLEDFPLGEILNELKRRNNTWFKGPESLLEEKITVKFKDLPVEDGVKRILHSISHALVYNANGRLAGLILFRKSNKREGVALKGTHDIKELPSAQISEEDATEDSFDRIPPSTGGPQKKPANLGVIRHVRQINKPRIVPIGPSNRLSPPPPSPSAGGSTDTLGTSRLMRNPRQGQ